MTISHRCCCKAWHATKQGKRREQEHTGVEEVLTPIKQTLCFKLKHECSHTKNLCFELRGAADMLALYEERLILFVILSNKAMKSDVNFLNWMDGWKILNVQCLFLQPDVVDIYTLSCVNQCPGEVEGNTTAIIRFLRV